MQLILGHLGPDRRQLKHLMAQRLRVLSFKVVATLSALPGLQDEGMVRREKGPLPPLMAGLSAREPP